MIEINSPKINVEDLMRHIREEILKQKHQLDQSSAPCKADGQIAEKQSYEIADFLVYDDEAFISNAYRGILRREPDEEGFWSALNQLRDHSVSKLTILINLRFSPEGKGCGVTVHGLLKSYLHQHNELGHKNELRMEPLAINEVDNITIKCVDKLDTLQIAQECLVKVKLTNASNRILSSSEPNPFNLSYHWEIEETGETVIYEGLRTPLNTPCLMVLGTEYKIKVKAPDEVGTYVLKIVGVQEGVRWHDSAESATLSINVIQ